MDPADDVRPPPSSAPARVEIRGDEVHKHQPPGAAAVELEKTLAAARIGANNRHFAVPEVLRDDVDSGLIVYRRVPGLAPVRTALAAPGWESLARSAALALVDIHRDLALAPALRRPMRLPGLQHPGTVWLHGDYSPTNVQLQAHSGRLWVLDWAAPAWIGPELTTGPPSVDLAMFILPLFWQRPGDPAAVPEPERRAGLFLQTWARETGQDPAPVAADARRLLRLRFPHAARLLRPAGVVARLPMQARALRWLRAVERGAAPEPA